MENGAIFTIGYGSRAVEELIGLLQRYNVEYMIDVRSQPYSRFKPEFSKDALQERLKQAGIGYVFMGDTLGGRPSDKSCYVNGKVDYAKVREKPAYQDGIKRLHAALDKHLTIALMCSEGKPQECHRSKLIGETLAEEGVEVKHIDETGGTKTQQEVITELTHGQQSLFDMDFTSRKRVGNRE
jgi:uncharacterized protein (DUF488 family)